MLETEIIENHKAGADEEFARSDVLDFVRYFTSIYAVDPNNLASTIDTLFEQSTSSKINPKLKRAQCTERQQDLINLVEKYAKHREDYKREKID